MGLFNKKDTDPISDRERALSAEIAALEAQIKSLNAGIAGIPASQSPAKPASPRLRAATLPQGASVPAANKEKPGAKQTGTGTGTAIKATDPIFEEVDQSRLNIGSSPHGDEDELSHFNDLGVRKYDLASFIRRLKNQFRGPSAPNPRFVTYLAAGSVQGLRPLRYEKRVARNRFLFVVAIILAILIGAFLYMFNHH
jgi:hypothetical protein